MAEFVHLHVHSEFSLLDGLSKIQKLVRQAKLFGMRHLAITDHGALYGAIKFFKECKRENLNPIIGCEMYIAPRNLNNKEPGKDNENSHLTVLSQDFEGYQNLMKLVTISYLEGFYYRPRVDKNTLNQYSKGLIALSGCNSSEIAKAIIQGNLNLAEKITREYIQIFGKKNFYLETQKHLFDKFKNMHDPNSPIYVDLNHMASEESKITLGIKHLAKKIGIPFVATNDVHYVLSEDAPAQDAIVCIQTGKNLSDIKRLRMIDSPTYYLKNTQEMEDLFEDAPLAIANSLEIAKKINIEINLGKIAFPKYDVPSQTSPDDYLRKLCFEGIKKKVKKVTKDIKERLDYELSVIFKKGYSTYFLVVADFVNWSRSKGIISTTRGSASGSLVSYSLGITTVDPLYFKLPFERFLNLYRPTLPDIDVDFADNRRDEVITYVRNKYGTDKVAQIGTFGTMMARAAVRDVARVMGLPYSNADKIAKMVPIGAQGFHMSLEIAKQVNKELGKLYLQDNQTKELLDLAEKVEGNARHVSVHAAGVVISPTELTQFTPLQLETSNQKIITQYDMYDIEDAGLVKMDFLGIRNLSILGQSVEIVASTRGEKVDLSTLPLDDPKAFEIMSKGETMGLFQLGGSGMTRYLKELKPTTIFDIMAMISLFRPGPMNSIPEFIERKHNHQKIKYFDPRMADYLTESYGVIVYQDDVLLTAINLAGYTWEEADKFRKAMGKKIPAEMTKQKEKFTNGCIKNGMSEEKADQLFKIIEPFAAYGFNKAHAASYAIIAYQTAYMKSNYPVEYMAAVMTAESDDPDKIAAAVAECGRMNILIFPPDVNFSETGFKIEKITGKRGIRFGLSAIKNVGKAAIEAILSEREEKGDFKNLNDFVTRVNLRVVNRKTLESLIKAGAMNNFGSRNAMLKILDDIRTSGASLSKTIATGQGSLFDDKTLNSTDIPGSKNIRTLSISEAPKEEILSWERELLGFYLTEHPLTKVSSQIAKLTTVNINDLDMHISSDSKIKIGGFISSVRRTFTKIKKEEMCFLKLQDISGTIEVLVFPRVYQVSKNYILPDQIIIIWGKLELSDQAPIVIAEKILSLNEAIKKSEAGKGDLEIILPKNADRILLGKIYKLLKQNSGDTVACLVLSGDNGVKKKFSVPFGIYLNSNLENELLELDCQVI